MKKIALWMLLFQIFLGPLATAKDFYLTVRRDFGSDEKPRIDVDYSNNEPLLIRVLKPKNLQKFISSQVDLRRAWKEPKVEDNLANAVAKGFNATRMDFNWLRLGLNRDFRNGLKSSLGGGQWNTESPGKIGMGPEKIISQADDFEPMQEFSMFPNQVDKKRDFDVPGFYYGSENGFNSVPVELGTLPAGFYVVQVIQGKSEGQVVLVVNDILAEMQQSSGRALVRVVNRKGQALSGISVKVRNLRGKWAHDVKTDPNGVADLSSFNENDSVVLIQSEKNGTAIMDTEFYPTSVSFPDVYLYSDRPMYKSGDLVQYKGVVRNSESGWSKIWTKAQTSKKVHVQLVPVNDNPNTKVNVIEETVEVGEYGTFVGSLKVPDGSSGIFRIVARIVDNDHVSEIRIKDYVKPQFFVEIQSEQETLRSGDELKAKIKVERYAGGVPSNVSFRYMLYRTRVSLPEWVSDAGMGESGSTTTYGFDESNTVSTSSMEFITQGEDATFDEKGIAEINLMVPSQEKGPFDYQYILKVHAFDNEGNRAIASREFSDVQSEVVAQARATATLLEQGLDGKLLIRALKQSGGSFGVASGSLVWTHRGFKQAAKQISETAITTDQNGKLNINIPTNQVGELKAIITLRDKKNRPSTTEVQVLVSPKDGSQNIIDVPEMVVLTRKENFNVGEKARALVLLPDLWAGAGKNKGKIYVTVAGQKIHSHDSISVNGTSFWYDLPIIPDYGTGIYVVFSYPDGQRGWIEKRIRFRIPKQDRLLRVTAVPEYMQLNPGAKQTLSITVNDSAGKPIESEFSVSVVDKAVLDLQPEFRPDLMEFFYPTQRLNLMSFFSNQFQGYGYGEKVARLFKPNMGWAAPKGNPPEELFEKDTAYWTGKVKTDAAGKAIVSFKLPPNQTTWMVSVVAVDKEGRFGEGKNKFKSQRTQSVLLASPNAIRVGDMLDLRLTVSSRENSAKEIPFILSFKSDGEKQGPASNFSGKVSSKLSPTYYHRIQFPEIPVKDAQAVLTANLKVNGADLEQNWPLKAERGTVEFSEFVKSSASQMIFSMNQSEKIGSTKLVTLSGLSGAVLPSLSWLIQYPHGCVEQLVNSTLPNIVAVNLLSVHKENQLSAEQKSWLETANENSKKGLQLLQNYQGPDGSFGWFSGEGGGDVAMTYFVMMSLAGTTKQETNGINLWKAVEFLEKTNPSPQSSQAIALAFIQSWNNPSLTISAELEARLRYLANLVTTQGSPLQRALVLRTFNNRQSRMSASLKVVQSNLAKIVSDDLKALVSGSKPISRAQVGLKDWQEYFGREASTLAIIGRSLYEVGKFPTELRQFYLNKILDSFNGSHFGSTYETSQTLLNLTWLLDIEAKEKVAASLPTITLDNAAYALDPKKVKKILGGFEIDLNLKNLKVGSHNIKVKPEGPHRLVLKKEVPLDKVQAMAEVAKITKQYFKVDEMTGKLTPVNEMKFQIGDLIYVKIGISKVAQFNKNYWQSEYYMMKEFLPMGMTIVEQDSIYESAPFSLRLREKKSSRRLIRGDNLQWYFHFDHAWSDPANRGQQEVGFLMRASYSGQFIGGVTQFEDFYSDGFYSLTPGARFIIDRKQ